jgi:two-component system sensor histidine kinase and response regulator WspE
MTEEESSLSDQTMLDLFMTELESQVGVMNTGLLALEKGEDKENHLKSLMRAAHSIKGAARIVHIDPIVQLAHAMEEVFVHIQQSTLLLNGRLIDCLFASVDFLVALLRVPKDSLDAWLEQQKTIVEKILGELKREVVSKGEEFNFEKKNGKAELQVVESKSQKVFDRILRVSALHMNRLMGLAGETLLEARVIEPIYQRLIGLSGKLIKCIETLNSIRSRLISHESEAQVKRSVDELHENLESIKVQITHRITELDQFIVRHAHLSDRLYHEVIDSRMRPFNDGVEGFPRMMRDLAKELNKKVSFEILGKQIPVDREILEKLESPLNHLLRNALIHGIESPEARKAAQKPEEGKITLEAKHVAGMLVITVSDDGSGINLEKLKNWIVKKKIVSEEAANTLNERELLDYLLVSGFSAADTVTEIAGRGVGLNIVQNMVSEVGGSFRIIQVTGKGTQFHLQLPLTLSVLRVLLVEVGHEPLAIPLGKIDYTLQIPRKSLEVIEGRLYFHFEGKNIGLISSDEILLFEKPA